MLFVAATALFMVGGVFAQTATNSSKDEASVAVAQEEMSAAVVEKKCDKKDGKKSCCKDKKQRLVPMLRNVTKVLKKPAAKIKSTRLRNPPRRNVAKMVKKIAARRKQLLLTQRSVIRKRRIAARKKLKLSLKKI